MTKLFPLFLAVCALNLGVQLASAQQQRPLVSNSALNDNAQGWILGQSDNRAQMRVIEAGLEARNGEFQKALHFDLTPQPGDSVFSTVLLQPISTSIRRGEPVTFKVFARSPQNLKFSAYVEDVKSFEKWVTGELSLSPQWKEFQMQGMAPRDFNAGEAQLTLHLGALKGEIEIAAPRLTQQLPASKPFVFDDTPAAPKAAPAGGVALLGNDPIANFSSWGPEGSVVSKTVDVQGQPFKRAFQVQTAKLPKNYWEAGFGADTVLPVKAGDVVLMTLYARALKGQAETGEARADVGFSTRGPDWSSSVSQTLGIGPQWKKFEVPFAVKFNSVAGQALMNFSVGFNTQTIEVGGVSLQNYGSAARVEDLPRTRTDYAGQETDAPWRKAALARIEKIRKGDVTFEVRDARGKPVKGAKIALRMKRHAFAFGTAVDAAFLTAPGLDNDQYRATILANYNQVSIENHMKWPFWEAEWGRTGALAGAKWAREHNLKLVGHNLVWPGWTNLPEDLPKIKDDKAALRKRIRDHFADILPQFRGQIEEWQVVNEPFAQNDLLKILGRDEMTDWFKLAKELDPTAKLYINDYPPLDGAATNNEHLNTYYSDIERLQKGGAPLQGIGFQCHFGSGVIPPERVLSGLDRFARFGLPIAITEWDMETTDELLQARYTRDFLTAAFSHPSVQSVMMWGFWEGKHWMPNASLYRRDWSLKPHGQVWLDMVKSAWWTNADGQTNNKGQFQTRGFYGDYEVLVSLPNGQTQTFPAQLEKAMRAPVVLNFKTAK